MNLYHNNRFKTESGKVKMSFKSIFGGLAGIILMLASSLPLRAQEQDKDWNPPKVNPSELIYERMINLYGLEVSILFYDTDHDKKLDSLFLYLGDFSSLKDQNEMPLGLVGYIIYPKEGGPGESHITKKLQDYIQQVNLLNFAQEYGGSNSQI